MDTPVNDVRVRNPASSRRPMRTGVTVQSEGMMRRHPELPISSSVAAPGVLDPTRRSPPGVTPVNNSPGIRSTLPSRRPSAVRPGTIDDAGIDVAARELEAERARFDAVVARSGDLVMFFDPDGTITWSSPASTAMFGIDPEDLIGINGLALIHPDDHERVIAAFSSISELGDHIRVEYRIVAPDGEVRWLEEIVTNLLDEPSVASIVGNLHDITERRRSDASAAQLAAIVQSSNDAILSTDLNGIVTSWNPAAEALFGHRSADIIGRSVTVIVLPEKQPLLAAALELVAGGQSFCEAATTGLRADGTIVDLSTSMSPLRDASGSVIGASLIGRDITERIELDRRIDAERRRLEDAQRSAGLGSFEIDLVANTLTRSDEFWRIIGRTPTAESGPDFSFVHHDDLHLVLDALRLVAEGHDAVDCTHRIVRPSGEVRWVVTRTSGVRDPQDPVVSGTMLDITDRRQAELEIEHLAFHDPLTGLPNRSKITAQLDEQLASAAADGPRIAVALVDLDHFKIINDSLGHSAGDAVLVAVARRIESVLDPDEVLARFGGDEFAVIRSEDDGGDVGAAFGHRLLAALESPVTVDQRDFHLTMSVGISLSAAGDDAECLFREADTAMYHAKETGRARVALYGEALRAGRCRRLDLRAALDTAVERREMAVVYQPVMDLATSRTVGFEALVRWNSPTFGPVSPDEFIPIAEEAGLIVGIGQWVLDEALAQVGAWRRDSPSGAAPWVAVNLSARQVEGLGLVERVSQALARADVPAEALHLELTESTLMDTVGSSLDTMNALHDMGIRLSIDDFGTGYSSLSYLKRLPIDTLKVDKSFVDGLGADPEDTSIIQAIVSLGRALRMDVLAEGVETDTQRLALIDLGCSHAQGFLWSAAVGATDAARWLDR